MSNIEVLKEQARRHEQKEEWRKALELYQKAIARLAEEDAPDIGLHNRVGDLFIRVGEVDQAVLALEEAIALYVESELPNNAIAVCKKVLRNVPNRHEIFLRMGQIRAQQGFFVDARTHFLTYAERMQVGGHLDEALRALVEFADAAPDDTEIRLAIAAHFQQHERTDEAVQQLVEGYRSALRQDLGDAVEVFRARLDELRPGVDPSDLMAEGPAEAEESFVVEATALGEVEESEAYSGGEGLLSEPPASLELDDVPFDVYGSDDEDEVFEMVPDLEDGPADEIAGAMEEALLELEETSEDAEIGLDSEGALDDAISAIGPDVSHIPRARDGHNPLEGFEVTDEGVLEFDAADDFDEDDDDTPLPLQTFHEPSEGADLPLLEGTQEEVESPFLHRAPQEVEPPFRPDRAEDTALPFLHVPAGVEEVSAPGLRAVEADEITEIVEETAPETSAAIHPKEPERGAPGGDQIDDLDALQRLVETAHRSGDDRILADAYVALGNALRRSGEETRAQAVFRQALQTVPDHPGAHAAVDAGPAREREVAEVASNEDYVDLGALILGESDEKTTRFVVAYEEPSGDEQADFAKMLSQFKAKVAENVDASDVKAHHDLGTAYKEMGLLDEAVEEFQAALRASSDHLPTYEMLGQTFLDKGTPETAVRVLTRALDSPFEVEDELLGIYYYLGLSHEQSGNKEQAREFYDRVFSLDINFADVTERLRALR
jgi:tetratricopeptide (TPR) repeat protein